MISVVIITFNQQNLLEQMLPIMLQQQEVSFEVIVVDKNSEDETPSYLERMEEQNSMLRHIVLPVTAHGIDKDHLAVMLGLRSALSDNVILMRPQCFPPTPQWLHDIAEAWTQHTPILMFPILYGKGHTMNLGQRIALFFARHGRARWSLGEAIGYRRSFFMDNGGFPSRTPRRLSTFSVLLRYFSKSNNTNILTDAKYSLHSMVS